MKKRKILYKKKKQISYEGVMVNYLYYMYVVIEIYNQIDKYNNKTII